MKKKIPLNAVLQTIENADLAACTDAVEFINQLDFYQYTQEELKCISDTLSTRLSLLLRLEIRTVLPA